MVACSELLEMFIPCDHLYGSCNQEDTDENKYFIENLNDDKISENDMTKAYY